MSASGVDELLVAVRSRLTGDFTLTGTNGFGVFIHRAQDDSSRYVLITGSASKEQTFESSQWNIDVQVEVFAEEGSDAARIQTARERIVGDEYSNGGVPAFGLDRWTPGDSGGWSFNALEIIDDVPLASLGNDIWGASMTFTTRAARERTS